MLEKIKDSLRLSYIELTQKVTWPSYDQLQESAIVVLIASLLISLVVFLMDTLFENLFKVIYELLAG